MTGQLFMPIVQTQPIDVEILDAPKPTPSPAIRLAPPTPKAADRRLENPRTATEAPLAAASIASSGTPSRSAIDAPKSTKPSTPSKSPSPNPRPTSGSVPVTKPSPNGNVPSPPTPTPSPSSQTGQASPSSLGGTTDRAPGGGVNAPKVQLKGEVASTSLDRDLDNPGLGNPQLQIALTQQTMDYFVQPVFGSAPAPKLQSGQVLQVKVKLEVSEIQGSNPGSIVTVKVQPDSPAVQSGEIPIDTLQSIVEKLLKDQDCQLIADPQAPYQPVNKPATNWTAIVTLKVL